jgi:hypothetical protein
MPSCVKSLSYIGIRKKISLETSPRVTLRRPDATHHHQSPNLN